MAVTRNKFSSRQAGPGVAVDVLALSPQARRRQIDLNAGQAALVVQNTSKYLTTTATYDMVIKGAYYNCVTAPAVSGGTATLKIERIATDGSTATEVVASVTLLSGITGDVAEALTLAATNPTEITAGQTIKVTVATSNHSVGTADAGSCISLLVEPVEDSVISDTDARGA